MMKPDQANTTVSDLDECECGDYRRDHNDGTGRCRMPDDLTHGNRPCFSFRLAFPASGPRSRAALAGLTPPMRR